MKKLFVLYALLLTTACGPEENETCHRGVEFYNNFDRDAYITVSSGVYPDTMQTVRRASLIFTANPYCKTPSGESNTDAIYNRRGCVESFFNYEDTIMFFVFDAYTVENIPQMTITDKYLVLRRYDLSKEDLILLNWNLYYPPTEEMKHMKMYPPYGR